MLLKLCDTKIEHLHRITAALIWFEPDVVRLQIAMDYALVVGLVDGRADLFENIERPANWQIFFLFKDLAKRAAIEIFHHEIGDLAVRRVGKAKIGDVNHVRMPQTPGGTGFAAKSLDKLAP